MNENALQIQPDAQIARYQEQNVSMVQQLAQAQIQSAYIMAERHPRDWDVAEQKILKAVSYTHLQYRSAASRRRGRFAI